MTPREQDATIAEWMGWRWWWNPTNRHLILCEPEFAPSDSQKYLELLIDRYDYPQVKISVSFVPRFFSDLNAMAQALKVVKERGLKKEYIEALIDVAIGPSPYLVLPTRATWLLLTATAPQKAEALCRVIDEEVA